MTQNDLLSQDDQPVIDENKDYFTELVGEGKKFKDEKALAKAKAYSDAHIALLEKQNEEYRTLALKKVEEADAGAKLQELSDKIGLQLQQLSSREQTPNSNEDKPAISQDEVKSLVSSEFLKLETSRKEQDNYNQVVAKAEQTLGANFKRILKDQALALKMTDDEVIAMAQRNPNLFYKTFDLNERKQGDNFQSPPKSDLNAFTPKTGEKRDWNYYTKLKRENPRVWLDKKIAIQMERDAQELGADFYKN